MTQQSISNPTGGQPSTPSFDADAYKVAKRELQVTGFQYLLGLHPFRGDELVVDLACGDGGATVNDLCPRVASGGVLGIDISPGMILAAQALPAQNARFLRGDIERLAEIEGLSLQSQSVDVFVSNYGMHWILGRERMGAFLRQVFELTKPGGVLLSLFAEDRVFPGFFERMHEVCAAEKWARFFDGGTFKHHPLPAIESFGDDVRASGFEIEILQLRQGWITFDSKTALVRGVIGWLPQYMSRLPEELKADFATEVVDRYADSTPRLAGYPAYSGGQIGVYDVSIVVKATRKAAPGI